MPSRETECAENSVNLRLQELGGLWIIIAIVTVLAILADKY